MAGWRPPWAGQGRPSQHCCDPESPHTVYVQLSPSTVLIRAVLSEPRCCLSPPGKARGKGAKSFKKKSTFPVRRVGWHRGTRMSAPNTASLAPSGTHRPSRRLLPVLSEVAAARRWERAPHLAAVPSPPSAGVPGWALRKRGRPRGRISTVLHSPDAPGPGALPAFRPARPGRLENAASGTRTRKRRPH